MATWTDVMRIAGDLPEVEERQGREGSREWRVAGKLFAWERPMRRSDLEALGEDAPEGPILATRVPDEGVKEALIGDAPDTYFTTPHFDGYAMVLTLLENIEVSELEEQMIESWLLVAPKRLAKSYLERR